MITAVWRKLARLNEVRNGTRPIGTRSWASLAGALVIGAALAAPSSALATTYTERTLPFIGLKSPVGVAVDPSGDVFATGGINAAGTETGVWELPAGSSIPAILPFTSNGLDNGVAVDPAGDVFASAVSRIVELPAGSTTQQSLPFTAVNPLGGNNVAVDAAGDVFITSGEDTVQELSDGGTTPQSITFPSAGILIGVAVDTSGDVYALEDLDGLIGAEVLEYTAGTDTFRIRGIIKAPGASQDGIAVDPAGDVFVSSWKSTAPFAGQVFELPADSSTPVVLPFTGLDRPFGVAADQAGDVFVADIDNNRIVELSPNSSSSGGGNGSGGGSGTTVSCVNTTTCTVTEINIAGNNTGGATITYELPSSAAAAIKSGTLVEAKATVAGRTRVVGRGRIRGRRLVIHLARLRAGKYSVRLIALPAHERARLLKRMMITIR